MLWLTDYHLITRDLVGRLLVVQAGLLHHVVEVVNVNDHIKLKPLGSTRLSDPVNTHFYLLSPWDISRYLIIPMDTGQRSASIVDLQERIVRWAKKTFGESDREYAIIRKLCMEELPELTLSLGTNELDQIGDELADVLILLLDLCEIKGIDLAAAIHKKMDTNEARRWEVDQRGISHHVT